MDTIDPKNPYFQYALNQMCSVCSRKASKKGIYVILKNAKVVDNELVSITEVLESFSNFRFDENASQLVCMICVKNASAAYKFQQMCNKSQMYYEDYTTQQQLTIEKMKGGEKIQIEISQTKDDNTKLTEIINIKQEPNMTKKQSAAKRPRPKMVQCKVCHKMHRSDNIRVHMRIHTGEKPYKCKLCPARFTQWSTLKYHTDAHENKKSFICRFCGKATNNMSGLRVHEMTHTGDKRHKCKDCDLAFVTSNGLKRHIVVHTNEKPYTCEYCAKSYNRQSTLRVHLKIHTGEKPHCCEFCGKKFIQLQSLRSHMRTHAKEQMRQAMRNGAITLQTAISEEEFIDELA